jgi:hypothetical protein
MAGSLHTYKLVVSYIQNNKTEVLSTAFNGSNQFQFLEEGAYETYTFPSGHFAGSSSNVSRDVYRQLGLNTIF